MSIKKVMLLASMALAAVAFAVPASASADGHFYHSGTTKHSGPIVGTPTVVFSGPILFASGLGGVECDAHASVILTTEDGHLEDLNITTDTCVGIGAFAGCELVDDEVTGLPATVTPTANDIDLEDIVIHNEFAEIEGGPGCAAEQATINASSITLIPDDKRRIGTVEVEGEALVEVFGLELEAEAGGHLVVTGGNAGTYGIESYNETP